MLSAYGATTEQERRNAIFEVNQQVILAGLYNGGFFDVAAFYGGTCLRIFHGLQRFSEDMDFSLLVPDDKFDFTKYFQPIIDEFAIVGREVEIKKKDKKSFGKVESAFLKDNTDVYDVSFQTDKSIKIKIEVDTQPPLNFRTEQKLLLQPHSFMTRCFTLPDLFAGFWGYGSLLYMPKSIFARLCTFRQFARQCSTQLCQDHLLLFFVHRGVF